MTLDIAAIKARAEKVPAILVTHRSPWYVSMDGVKDANQCWMFKGSGSLDRQIAELANYASTARTDIPALIAALEASEAARVKAEQDAERLLTALEDHRNLLKCYVDEFGDVEISMEGFSMPTNTRAIKAEQERDALRNFVADFADTNIAMLPMPHIKHPADEPDKAVSAAEVWEWQNDARRALESKP